MPQLKSSCGDEPIYQVDKIEVRFIDRKNEGSAINKRNITR